MDLERLHIGRKRPVPNGPAPGPINLEMTRTSGISTGKKIIIAGAGLAMLAPSAVVTAGTDSPLPPPQPNDHGHVLQVDAQTERRLQLEAAMLARARERSIRHELGPGVVRLDVERTELAALSPEAKHAHEIVTSLLSANRKPEGEAAWRAMVHIFGKAESAAGEPPMVNVDAAALDRVAAHFRELGIPLTDAGLATFRSARLITTKRRTVGLDTALAYARALDGKEMLYHLSDRRTPEERGALAVFQSLGIPGSRHLLRVLGLEDGTQPDGSLTITQREVGALVRHAGRRNVSLTPKGITAFRATHQLGSGSKIKSKDRGRARRSTPARRRPPGEPGWTI